MYPQFCVVEKIELILTFSMILNKIKKGFTSVYLLKTLNIPSLPPLSLAHTQTHTHTLHVLSYRSLLSRWSFQGQYRFTSNFRMVAVFRFPSSPQTRSLPFSPSWKKQRKWISLHSFIT